MFREVSLKIADGFCKYFTNIRKIKDQFVQCEKGTFFDGGGGGGGFYDQNGPILLSGCILRPHRRTDICVTREK